MAAEIGTSGHISVQLIDDEYGELMIRVEQTELGEIIDLPDLATAREVWYLLSEAMARMVAGQATYWIDTGSGPGAVVPLRDITRTDGPASA